MLFEAKYADEIMLHPDSVSSIVGLYQSGDALLAHRLACRLFTKKEATVANLKWANMADIFFQGVFSSRDCPPDSEELFLDAIKKQLEKRLA